MDDDFLHTTLGRSGLRVHRLGLSAIYWPGKRSIHTALDSGLNLILCSPFDPQMNRALKDVLPSHRDELVLFTGGFNLIGRIPDLRRSLEKRLRKLGIDHFDIFIYGNAKDNRHLHEYVLDQLRQFKDEGKTRAIGISTHNRALAGQLAQSGLLDVLMVRYNAAHRGAEQDIFPHLSEHAPGLISYTATCWRYLLRRPPGYPKDQPLPTAADCYRFALSHPQVHVCLSAPSNLKQTRENLKDIERGPLTAKKLQFMREFGDRVYKRRKRYR